MSSLRFAASGGHCTARSGLARSAPATGIKSPSKRWGCMTEVNESRFHHKKGSCGVARNEMECRAIWGNPVRRVPCHGLVLCLAYVCIRAQMHIYIYANSIHTHRDTGYFFFGAHSARLAACLFHSAFSPANSEVQKTSATNAPHTFHLLAAGAHLQLHIARPLEARLTAGRHGGLQF